MSGQTPAKAFRPNHDAAGGFSFGLLPLLASCTDFRGAGRTTGAPNAAPAPEERVLARSPASFADERFYAEVEQSLTARGLLRGDGGGPDTPFTATMLARNFTALSFSEEFSEVGGRIVRESAQSSLHRWVNTVRLMPVFGGAVSDAQEARDRAEIERLAVRLSRSARHPVGVVKTGGNFPVLVLYRDELVAARPLIQRTLPGITETELNFVTNLPPETYCVLLAADRGDTGAYTSAVAIIRAELPDRLRTSCLHEEIAQGLGLANDSPDARPSIFNDDDEFGRLTSMDELMLRLLYDTRLAPGVSEDEAAPLVRTIARELVDGGVG